MKAAIRAVKNTVLQYTDIEIKVREATHNDPNMANNSLLQQISRATYDPSDYSKLFAMLWKRLNDVDYNTHVYKALYLLEYLLKHGSPRLVADVSRRSRDIAALVKYKHYDVNNVDDSKETRLKAKAIYELILDQSALDQLRQKLNKDKGFEKKSKPKEESGQDQLDSKESSENSADRQRALDAAEMRRYELQQRKLKNKAKAAESSGSENSDPFAGALSEEDVDLTKGKAKGKSTQKKSKAKKEENSEEEAEKHSNNATASAAAHYAAQVKKPPKVKTKDKATKQSVANILPSPVEPAAAQFDLLSLADKPNIINLNNNNNANLDLLSDNPPTKATKNTKNTTQKSSKQQSSSSSSSSAEESSSESEAPIAEQKAKKSKKKVKKASSSDEEEEEAAVLAKSKTKSKAKKSRAGPAEDSTASLVNLENLNVAPTKKKNSSNSSANLSLAEMRALSSPPPPYSAVAANTNTAAASADIFFDTKKSSKSKK
jgi:hypothetical protein